jgi:hypothetical protein
VPIAIVVLANARPAMLTIRPPENDAGNQPRELPELAQSERARGLENVREHAY